MRLLNSSIKTKGLGMCCLGWVASVECDLGEGCDLVTTCECRRRIETSIETKYRNHVPPCYFHKLSLDLEREICYTIFQSTTNFRASCLTQSQRNYVILSLELLVAVRTTNLEINKLLVSRIKPLHFVPSYSFISKFAVGWNLGFDTQATQPKPLRSEQFVLF